MTTWRLSPAIVLLLAVPVSGQVATVDQILAHVQASAGQFERALPDFVCDEKITSRATYKGTLHETVIESHFVGLQKKSGNLSYTEKREVVTVNGEPATGNQNFNGPFLFGGGFSSMLDLTFAAENVPSQTYTIAREEIFGDRTALVLEFATRHGQKDLYFLHGKKTFVENDIGKAWIDKQSMQLLRLERHFLNVAKGATPIIATVDYGEVQIGGKPFWMPLVVRAGEASYNVGRRHGMKGDYFAAYTNYRKFEVSSGIVFDDK